MSPTNDGLRVAVRLSSQTSGGGRVFARQLVDSLCRASGVGTVTAFVTGDPTELDLVERARVVTVDAAASPLRRRAEAGLAMRRAAAGGDVDVLLCPGTQLTRVAGIPSVLWPLTVAPFEPHARAALGGSVTRRLRWRILREAVRIDCGRADGLVFSSHYARAVHEAANSSLREVPSTVIWPAASLLPTARSKLSSMVAPKQPYILFVSHLYPYKMAVELVQGFARFITSTNAPHDLVLAGATVDHGYARRLRATITELRLEARVHVLGNVDAKDLPALYEGAESFVFPSISENAASYALIDALSFGKPVVSSYLSSMPEICQDAVRYVDPRDPVHIAAGLSSVSSDSSLRQQLSSRATARAVELPTWDDIAARLVAFVSPLVDRSAAEVRP